MNGPKNERSKKKMVQFQSEWTKNTGKYKELGPILIRIDQKSIQRRK
ncbi:hypothetical protein BSG1_16580 [Bacillus sp. SG-1]|nr:hypothetical protein BSG1_16580 [Bacillus sp. SG-1]